MSFMSMLTAFLITFGVALGLVILVLSVRALWGHNRTKFEFLSEMLVPKIKRGPYIRTPGMMDFGLGEWLDAELERGKEVHRPRGSRSRHTKSHEHHR